MEYVLWLIISTLHRAASHAWVCTQIFITSYPHNTHSELEYNYILEKGTETCTSDLLVNVFTYTLCYFLPGKETLTTYYIDIFSKYIYGWIGSVFVLYRQNYYKNMNVLLCTASLNKRTILVLIDMCERIEWVGKKIRGAKTRKLWVSCFEVRRLFLIFFIYASIFRPLQYKLVQKGFNISGSR